MTIGELCNRMVVIAEAQESTAVVASLMASRHVGCVVIVDGLPDRRVPVGIVTDRDLALTVVARDLDASATAVAQVMTTAPYVAREEQDAYTVLEQMQARGPRRAPVVDHSGYLQGIFTFDDMVEWTAEHMLQLTRLVKRELSREAGRLQMISP